jgi:outer membrane protein, heavy metal efflux system
VTLRQQQRTSTGMLNSLLARPVQAALPIPKKVAYEKISLGLEILLAQAEQANPELARIRQKIDADKERLELAHLQRWPDLTVSYSYNFVNNDGMSPEANGKDQWWVGFGVNVPVWFQKYDAAERESRAAIHQGSAELEDLRNRLAFQVQDAWTRVDTQQRLAGLLLDVSIPHAQHTLDVSFSSYSAGKVDFLTLASNWRTVLNFKLAYQQNLAELERSFAELQQAVGRDIQRNEESIEEQTNPEP